MFLFVVRLLVTEMASPKCKGFLKKKRSSETDVVISSLRKENFYLKTLVELSLQHSEHYKLVEVVKEPVSTSTVLLCIVQGWIK